MKKIDIGQSLANPNVARALSEFTVGMMNNSDVTKILREAIARVQDKDKDKDTELKSTSKKLIQAIESYNKKLLKNKVGFASSTTPHKYDLWTSSSNEPLYKKNDIVFYVNLKKNEVVKAKIIAIEYAVSPPSYTIKRNDTIDNAELNVEEYTLRVYDDNVLNETKNVWLAEVILQKVDNKLIDLINEISKMKADSNSIQKSDENYKKSLSALHERGDAMSKVRVALAQEDKALQPFEDPLTEHEMNRRIKILNKWDMDPLKEVWAKAKEAEQISGGRNRRTKKAHYYSKRRRTRHYRSKRVRSK